MSCGRSLPPGELQTQPRLLVPHHKHLLRCKADCGAISVACCATEHRVTPNTHTQTPCVQRAPPRDHVPPLQVQFSLLSTAPLESGLMDVCQELGITVVAYSPLALGALSGADPSELWGPGPAACPLPSPTGGT